jgi:poly-gamma-glutamate synthesis protein (capsule biosynthesis protein)
VEYAAQPQREQGALARQMIDAGADLVVGGHPHVVQPLEPYHGRWIAYSLGNFVFDQKAPGTHRGLMLQVMVTDKQISEVTPIPIVIDRTFQARLAPAEELDGKAVRASRAPTPPATRAQ